MIMKVLTDRRTNVILAISNTVELIGENLYQLDHKMMSTQHIDEPIINDVENVPSEVVEDRYCYTPDKEFTLNPNFGESSDIQVRQLKQDMILIKAVLDDIILNGGLI